MRPDNLLLSWTAELDALDERLRAAVGGAGGVIVVAGPPGSGKSRLLSEIASRAEAEGLRVFVGHGGQQSPEEPFLPLAEAFASAAHTTDLLRSPELEPYLGALCRLLPEMPRSGHPSERASTFALLEGLHRLLRVVADDAGAVLLLHDVHLGAAELIGVITYLADNLVHEPALCVVSLDSTAPGSAALLLEAENGRPITVIRPRRLSDDDVTRLVWEHLGGPPPPGLVEDVAARAGGCPGLVIALVEAAAHGEDPTTLGVSRDRIPARFQRAVCERLRGLDDMTRSVVRVQAVVGGATDPELLAAITGLDDSTVMEALRAATEVGLLVDNGAAVTFPDVLTRESLIATTVAPERATIARAVLPLLLDTEAAHNRPADIAELLYWADEPVEATDVLVSAAKDLLVDGSLAEAARILGRACQLAPRTSSCLPDALETLVEVLLAAGRWRRATEAATRLLDVLSDGYDNPRRVGACHARLGRARLGARDLAGARAAFATAAEHERPHDHLLGHRLAIGRAWLALYDGDGEGALAIVRELYERPIPAGAWAGIDAADMVELADRVAFLHHPSSFAPAVAPNLILERLANSQASRLHRDVFAVAAKATAAGELGPWVEFRRLASDGGVARGVAMAELGLAWNHTWHYELDAGAEAASRCLALALDEELDIAPFALTARARNHLLVGREDELRVDLGRLAEWSDGRADVAAVVDGEVRTFQHLLRGDRDGAVALLDQAMAGLGGPTAGWAWPFQGLWLLLRALDDPHLECDLSSVHGRDSRWLVGYRSLVMALQMGASQGERGAAGWLEDATMYLGTFPWHLHQARLIVAERALAEGWGQPLSWLREAMTFFGDCGHPQLVSECRALLSDAGEAVPRRGRRDFPIPPRLRAVGVSGREAEVMALVAAGRSNRDIADELVLSLNTIKTHVATLLRKTGASTRSELAMLWAIASDDETAGSLDRTPLTVDQLHAVDRQLQLNEKDSGEPEMPMVRTVRPHRNGFRKDGVSRDEAKSPDRDELTHPQQLIRSPVLLR